MTIHAEKENRTKAFRMEKYCKSKTSDCERLQTVRKNIFCFRFCPQNYKMIVYLNFFENPDYASVFAGSLEVDNIVMMLTALLGSTAVFEAGETVLVLDEIQDCPEARTALKFFRIDGRYDVIGTGSLLGVKGYGKEPKSIPVGSETVVDMYPLDFEEFLWANGITDGIIDMLEKKYGHRISRTGSTP